MNSPQFDYQLLKSVGKDVFISSKVEIRRPHLVSLGNCIAIDTGFYCTTEALLNSYIHIGPYVTCIGGAHGLLQMGNFTNIGAGSRLICVSEEHLGEGLIGPTIPDRFKDKYIGGPIVFQDFSGVGTHVVVMPGVIFGEGAIVAPCSFVNKNLEPWTIYAGVPARPVRRRPKEKMISMARELSENCLIFPGIPSDKFPVV